MYGMAILVETIEETLIDLADIAWFVSVFIMFALVVLTICVIVIVLVGILSGTISVGGMG